MNGRLPEDRGAPPSINISPTVKSLSSKLAIMPCITSLNASIALDQHRHRACIIGACNLKRRIGSKQLGNGIEVNARGVEFLQQIFNGPPAGHGVVSFF